MARRTCLLVGACCFALAGSLHAQELTDYTYDALGRLVKVDRSGGSNDGVDTDLSYDDAGNRTSYVVAGAPTPSPTPTPAPTPTPTPTPLPTPTPTPPPSFAINDQLGNEGDAITFTVTRSGTTSGSYTLSYSTGDGSATAGSDYVAKSSTLPFSSGQTSATISVSTIEDSTVEPNETFGLTLLSASGGATISDGQGVGTIINDDETPPSFAVNDASVTEGGALSFTVTKTGSVSNSYSVSYGTLNNTATAGSDYTAKSGTLTFTATQTSQSVTIATIDDTADEPNETLYLNLSGATGGAMISDGQGVGTIIDNDEPPNSPPVANDDYGLISCNGPYFFDVVANDTDPDNDILRITTVGGASAISPVKVSDTTIRVNGQASSYVGQVTYSITDDRGGADTAVLIIEWYNDGTCGGGGGGPEF